MKVNTKEQCNAKEDGIHSVNLKDEADRIISKFFKLYFHQQLKIMISSGNRQHLQIIKYIEQ